MSKPMLVTLPFVLLLLDYWPLDRIKGQLWNRVVEKIPLIALSAISSIATFGTERCSRTHGGITHMGTNQQRCSQLCSLPLADGLAWGRLAVFYPHPENRLLFWEIIFSLLFMSITALAIVLRKKRSYLIMGWLWYLGMLVPVIGLVQVGWQGRADRYTYLPQIGLYIAATWGVTDLTALFRHQLRILSTAAMLIISAL